MMELHLNDEDGRELFFTPYDDDHLTALTHNHESKRTHSVKLHVTDVDRLWAFLGEWLNQGTAPATPAPLTAADVRAIASQVAAEVVALHTRPQARLSDAVAARLCTVPDCKRFPGVSEHFEHDVDTSGWDARSLIRPHTEICRGGYGCDIPGVHVKYASGCGVPEPGAQDAGHPLDADTPYPEPFRPEPDAQDGGIPAGNSWSDLIWNGDAPVCCTIPVPTGTVLTDTCGMCGHLWTLHERTPEPERPPTIPCGLCGKPWHDGHGYPGDPCVGAPKQLVGCECGHGWGAHSTAFGCTAANRECECTRTAPSAAVTPEPVKAACTCHRHSHTPGENGPCTHEGCFCRSTRTAPSAP